jgi:hypothetical protein
MKEYLEDLIDLFCLSLFWMTHLGKSSGLPQGGDSNHFPMILEMEVGKRPPTPFKFNLD